MSTIFADVATIEPQALEQYYNALKHDFTIDGALMPDAHTGYSLPIGGVILTNNAVVPAWVGYDIGCGVSSFQFPKDFELNNISQVMEQIQELIPVGQNIHKTSSKKFIFKELLTPESQEIFEERNALLQLGTLGSGNHFVELGYSDQTNSYYLTVHSGSRGFGHGVATYYMNLAKKEGLQSNNEYYFKFDHTLGQKYLLDMQICVDFAFQNRYCIIKRIIDNVFKLSYKKFKVIDCIHNTANLDGRKRILHRKGASMAIKGQDVIIPGNMRDGLFICEGLSNPASFSSCSHGAGRVLSRRKAKEVLNFDEFKNDMNNANIISNLNENTLDEAPNAYKNIFEVMEYQKELVTVKDYVKPVLNLKG